MRSLSRTSRFGSLLVVLLACSGCPSDDDVPVDAADVDVPRTDVGAGVDASVGRIEIGTGLTDFIEVEDGGDVELVMGPQGGWHVDVALRLYDLDPMDMQLTIEGFDITDDESATIQIERLLTLRRVREEDDHYLRVGDQLVFTVADGSQAEGRDIRIEVQATQADGGVGRASKVIHVVDLMP